MYEPVLRIGLSCCAVLSWMNTATANDDSVISIINDINNAPRAHTIDTRDLKSCSDGSLPGARCLPMGHFIDPAGNVIDFHALRWLLGTVGLSGDETVLVIGANASQTQKIGALLHHAGQRQVHILSQPFVAATNAPPGVSRSLSREVVFTAPMRDVVIQ